MARPSKFDLYPKAREPWSEELFRQPTAEYRGCPLWAWNSRLHKPILRKEIRALREMGIGGFTMHARVGLDTPYLGDKYMSCVEACVKEAKKLDMKAYLYDEDRWPSGAAGGLITKEDPSLRMLHLLFTPWKYGTPGHGADTGISTGSAPFRGESGYLLGRYAVKLDESGYMSYRHMQNEDSNQPSDVLQPGEEIWYAYVEASPPSSWYNDAWYIDTMSKKAMKAFLNSTYEKYYKADGVGSEFGKTVTAIFTDEPQFSGMVQLETATEKKDCFAPWTEGLQDSFKNSTGLDIVATLPELFWDKIPKTNPAGVQDSISLTRYKYFDHIGELFCEAFLDQLSEWCEAHSLGQMGHMMEEPTLLQQTQCLGEAMRTYRSMQIPGVDMLVDSREYNTVKQCSSVVRQYGRTGCMSELYGVTNWTFPFKGYVGQGNWQAALGVTLRSHHLSWVSMNGEAKRDYPAQIGFQSPWYKEFEFVEGHFARVAIAMARGKARTRVAVLHPIESFWLRYGCKQTGREQGAQDQWFASLTEWLLFGLVDFDFLSESLLPELVTTTSNPIKVGKATYDVIILPQLLTIRSTTMTILEDFVAQGGKVFVAGRDPLYVDARPSTRFERLQVDRISFEKESVLRVVEKHRDIDICHRETGKRVDDLLYQWRDDGESDSYVFITNTARDDKFKTTITFKNIKDKTNLELSVMDTLTAQTWPLKVKYSKEDKSASFDWVFDGCASLLLHLSIGAEDSDFAVVSIHEKEQARDQDYPDWEVLKTKIKPHKTGLDEPNCLLLDFCRYKVDDETEWSALDEILRIDDQIRDKLKMHRRGDAMAQPWITPRPRPTPSHTVYLQYMFESAESLSAVDLALEGAELTKIKLDGVHVPIQDDEAEYWVDDSISRVPLPQITKGKHEIILEVAFDELNTSLERIYLLGGFAVTYDRSGGKGEAATVSAAKLDKIQFGDYTEQGLPFYTGNITYTFPVTGTGQRTAIRIPELGVNPVVAVSMDGERVGRIALPPYQLDLGTLDKKKEYDIAVTVFGNRDHAFGAVHAPENFGGAFSPGAWRTQGDAWSDGYTIRKMGLLRGVELLVTG